MENEKLAVYGWLRYQIFSYLESLFLFLLVDDSTLQSVEE